MALSDLEKEILAEGERIREVARRGALELRKSALIEEIKKVQDELTALARDQAVSHQEEPAPEPAPEPEPEPEPEPAPEPPAPEAAPEPQPAPEPEPEPEPQPTPEPAPEVEESGDEHTEDIPESGESESPEVTTPSSDDSSDH